jgi:hypothetical protein
LIEIKLSRRKRLNVRVTVSREVAVMDGSSS